MAANGVSMDVHDHGVSVVVLINDKERKRARCNYCEKDISCFSRLKLHLGGIRGDVAPCDRVPAEVKEAMRSEILDKQKGCLINEVGEFSNPDLPWKRNLNTCAEPSQQGTSQPSGPAAAKRVRTDHTSVANGNGPVSLTIEPGSDSMPNGSGSVYTPNGSRLVSVSNWPRLDSVVPNGLGSVSVPNWPEDVPTRHFQMCVGRFFFETGTDFLAAKAPSFQSMMNAAHSGGQIGYALPTHHDLNGWILQDAVKEMQAYVEEVRNSWRSTGCSILLDEWSDENNRVLVNILVDCPKGAVYLGSCDISAYVGDVNALVMFLGEILKEVGEENVVQIVAHNILGPMETVGKLLMDKHKTVFWTVSSSLCIELMLEKIGKRDLIRSVLEEAKTVTKFVHGDEGVLKLLESQNCGWGLVKPSKFKFAMSFFTLENIVSKKEFLVKVFNSLDWTNSIWATQTKGKRVSEIVRDCSFWTRATMALKAATPLVRVLELINEGGTENHCLGYIYESIDQAKVKIKEEFENEESEYEPFWKDIDEIWNTCLHSPLHAAGYFLNPKLCYSPDFLNDVEVFRGLLCCVARMGGSPHDQGRIPFQVDDYQSSLGGFSQGRAPDIRSKFSPAIWWGIYGGQCPELQRLAIRLLSQTCRGASRYNLKRELAEQLLTKGRNCIEQQRLINLAFVHYNLHLKNFELGRTNGIVLDEIDPTDDWIAETEAPNR